MSSSPSPSPPYIQIESISPDSPLITNAPSSNSSQQASTSNSPAASSKRQKSSENATTTTTTSTRHRSKQKPMSVKDMAPIAKKSQNSQQKKRRVIKRKSRQRREEEEEKSRQNEDTTPSKKESIKSAKDKQQEKNSSTTTTTKQYSIYHSQFLKKGLKPIILPVQQYFAIYFRSIDSVADEVKQMLKSLAEKEGLANASSKSTTTTDASSTSDEFIQLWAGPSFALKKHEWRDSLKLVAVNSKAPIDEHSSVPHLIFQVLEKQPRDFICSFLEFKQVGAIAICGGVGNDHSAETQDDHPTILTLSEENQLFLSTSAFLKRVLEKKIKRKRRGADNSGKPTKRSREEYEGVQISEWVQIDEEETKVQYVDNQLHEPGDGVCLFNWVSFRCAAAKLLQERIERERKYGVKRKRRGRS